MTAAEALRRRYGDHVPGLMGARWHYAVLVPLVQGPGGTELLFETRSAGVRQGGEVCFPGGRAETGETAEDCALRETEEELSIPRREVELLGKSDFLCNQRGFLLQPVLGLVSPAGLEALRPAPAEVAEVFTVPLDFFRRQAPVVGRYALTPELPPDFPYEEAGIPRDYAWSQGEVEVPSWRYGDHLIWGMTARILRDILRCL